MSQNNIKNATIGSLIILTILSILVSLPQVSAQVISERFLELSVYSLLTAFALILSIPLSRGELSITHAIGMIAFLSLDSAVAPTMTLAIFIGSLLGSSVLYQLQSRTNQMFHATMTWTSIVHMVSRITLSFFVASRLYTTIFGATLPISSSADFQANLTALIAYGIIYVVLMIVSLILEIETHSHEARSIVQKNIASVSIILTLPVPFAYIGASVARTDESMIFFAVTVIGVALIILGLYALNRIQEQLRRQLDEMHSISVATRALSNNLELDGVLRTAYVQVSNLMNTANFTVALKHSTSGHFDFPLVIRNGQELTVEKGMLPDDIGLIEYIMETDTPLLIKQDVAGKARELGCQPPTKPLQSWLGVPLVANEKSIGAFVVQSYDQRTLNEDDLRLLNIIVASTSIAVENSRLYQQRITRADQLATLNRVTALLTSTLSPNEVLDTIVSSASTIADATAVAVFLFTDEKTNELTLMGQAGLTPQFDKKPIMPHLSSDLTITNENFLNPQSVVIKNIDESEYVTKANRERLKVEGKLALMENPLTMSDVNLGILVLYFDNPQTFDDEQIDLIQAFTTQAAQAISNARRFATTDEALEQHVEQLHSLASMGRLLNATMDLNKIYGLVLNYASDATKAPYGAVILKRDNNRLTVLSQRGYPDNTFDDTSILLQGLTGRVLKGGQPFRSTDTRRETAYLPLVPDARSLLLMPILKGQAVLGLIMLESDKTSAFTESDAQFISQVANQAVIAMDNTRLFHRVRENRDNMQVILNAMDEGIVLINEAGQIALANPRVNLIELDSEALIEQSVDGLIEKPDLNFATKLGFSTNESLQRLMRNIRDGNWTSPKPHSYEIHGDEFGIRYIQRQMLPIHDEKQNILGVLLVFYNKTEENELARARESFSQMIVHDLRSPLTAVTTSLRLLDELVPKEADYRPVVDKTTAASRRAIRKVLARVDSLLDVSKMESGEIRLDKEATPIAQLVESVRTELHPLADELEVEIISNVSYDLPLTDIDGDKVERMILNLVDNALKYSPANAKVIVSASISSENFLQLEIADEGPGIPDDYKRRLFDRFVQVEGRKTVRRGVGLGLTFCKLVAEAHGGNIWVEDNPTGGSIFKVTLPIARLPEIAE